MASRICFFVVLAVAFTLTTSVPAFSASSLPVAEVGLRDEPVLRVKAPISLPDRTKQFLVARDGDTVRVWVFFTDKGIFDKSGFAAAAADVTITERALKRRAKVGLDKVVFIDLPVVKSYVQQIVDLGAKHRRSSRWLNAASFEVPVARLDQIEALPFVVHLKPMMRYRASPIIAEEQKRAPPKTALTPTWLDYGYSFWQLWQIKAITMHSNGYTGRGVTLAMLDVGFMKKHRAFESAFAEGRVLAEWDFLRNDSDTDFDWVQDSASQGSHGTMTWSLAGGEDSAFIYGPAYKANFILCKTEDAYREFPSEEDNWVAAVEFSDSLGADVISSSLAWLDWEVTWSDEDYTYANLDGQTCTSTLTANTCAALGIVLCSAMGNEGPGSGTLMAPNDAYNTLAIGAIDMNGVIAFFSSRGPTADGRIKPDVCANGTNAWSAYTYGQVYSTNQYGWGGGTSAATPLVAGAVCLLLEACPWFAPELAIAALKNTADNATSPNNTYGWGVINVDSASTWGPRMLTQNTFGAAPLEASFTSNGFPSTGWYWEFGDGNTSSDESATHIYEQPGRYAVRLTATTSYGDLTLFYMTM